MHTIHTYYCVRLKIPFSKCEYFIPQGTHCGCEADMRPVLGPVLDTIADPEGRRGHGDGGQPVRMSHFLPWCIYVSYLRKKKRDQIRPTKYK